MNKNHTCANCAYSEKSTSEVSQYFCKRFPPQVVSVPVMGANGPGAALQSTNSAVHPDNYCGEFERRINDEGVL